ncbi:protein FAM163A-like [Sinocyclocheilus rhinocerous]|uniref:Protein FAM163A-like n=1 Tax=Sinocyclocheilus rhinocerous TaxID=307959 RepID=A0A673IUY7_9TELE|nr:PREDICTED: protein FAM163A-like [Sinocyclocheilus rhinocerous]XP_016376596.1 PREDICTED: protein FAM163A-like [Sinocyclocheilus rhinocerous]
MTAGTVVITGGILATVILLCIIVVLCYCRLQYYCCKKNGSDPDAVCSQPQFACNACSTTRLDGVASNPLSLSPEPTPPQSFCPTCSPYSSPFYISTMDEMRNGAERITYMPSHYDSPCLSLTLPSLHSASLSSRSRPDLYSNTRAISTDV